MLKQNSLVIAMMIGMAGVPAHGSECSNLIQELEAMRKAQNTLLTSLADNHETFATSIDGLTSELELRDRKVPMRAVKSMGRTAQAYRTRGRQAKATTAQLNEGTADLIERVSGCLRP